jgi:dihydrofolate reductase
MIGDIRIEGYVIASADGMIADGAGDMPLSLQLEPDKVYFEAALEDIAAVVHGRRSQEIHPKSPERRRLVLTHAVTGLAPHPENPKALLWNPDGAPLKEALAALGVAGGRVAILGGPRVYSHFLEVGYDVFHLCRAVDVRVPGGLPVFDRARFGGEPEAALRAAGLRPGPTVALGEGVTLVDWTPP